MRFKKIYLEITNICNLDCSFCPKNSRPLKFMSLDDFNYILDKIKDYTNYIYFHLMGEPLIHPQVNEFIAIATKKNFKVNITSNGYRIDIIKDNKNIRQVNISLQAYSPKYQKSLDEYLKNIFLTVDNLLLTNTIVNLRVWQDNIYTKEILKRISNHYNTSINGNTKIKDNLYVDFAPSFIWPDEENDYENIQGSCRGLIDHIGILVNGTVVPCCLDYNGKLALGNIFTTPLEDTLKSPKAQNMLNGFKNNLKVQKMCQHCNFYDRIKQASK